MAVQKVLLRIIDVRWALCAALGLLLLTSIWLGAYRLLANRTSDVAPSLAVRAVPISIHPHPQRCLPIADDDLQKIRDQVQPLDEGLSSSLYLHALRVFGPNCQYQRGKLSSSSDTLKLFADEAFSRKIFGSALMVPTPYGIRCTSDRSHGKRESHRDYCLAVLSEQGVPIDLPMNVGGKAFTFRDFLKDSIANFHLDQEEIEWTAMAYAMWLPPDRTWTNKFGQRFSFDQLATELLQRPLDRAVCAGGHVVQALIVLARVDDEECSILTPEVRSKVMGRLAESVREVEVTQAADGSWGPDWYERLLNHRNDAPAQRTWSIDNSAVEGRLLATSHIAEWLMYLPEELQVPDERLARSGRWLVAQLKDRDSEFVKKNFCPCTHGAIVLQLIRSTADEPVVDQPHDGVFLSVHMEDER